MKIGIVGYGWVGKAMKQLFPTAFVYSHSSDPDGNYLDPRTWETHKDIFQKILNKCDIVFICLPTPVIGQGKLDTSMVEEAIKWCEAPLLIVRSTVNPGDCDRWTKKYKKEIVFQPEYLGETPAHPMLDPKTRPFLILGGSLKGRREAIELYSTVYNANITIRQTTLKEAEVIKLTENRAIGFKVVECQELYDACEATGVDYYQIRDAVYNDDPRFNLWWTFIYPDKRGFNSKCIPKDIYAWCAWAESVGIKPVITRAILKKNREWIK